MPESKNSKEALEALKKAVFDADTCGDVTDYKCAWPITGGKDFEKHLAKVHPEGEHR